MEVAARTVLYACLGVVLSCRGLSSTIRVSAIFRNKTLIPIFFTDLEKRFLEIVCGTYLFYYCPLNHFFPLATIHHAASKK